jgi:hypothetical protein
MAAVAQFMNGTAGRVLRAALGAVLIAYGLFGLGGVGGGVLAVVGLIPLALGTTGRCLLEPLARTTR